MEFASRPLCTLVNPSTAQPIFSHPDFGSPKMPFITEASNFKQLKSTSAKVIPTNNNMSGHGSDSLDNSATANSTGTINHVNIWGHMSLPCLPLASESENDSMSPKTDSILSQIPQQHRQQLLLIHQKHYRCHDNQHYPASMRQRMARQQRQRCHDDVSCCKMPVPDPLDENGLHFSAPADMGEGAIAMQEDYRRNDDGPTLIRAGAPNSNTNRRRPPPLSQRRSSPRKRSRSPAAAASTPPNCRNIPAVAIRSSAYDVTSDDEDTVGVDAVDGTGSPATHALHIPIPVVGPNPSGYVKPCFSLSPQPGNDLHSLTKDRSSRFGMLDLSDDVCPTSDAEDVEYDKDDDSDSDDEILTPAATTQALAPAFECVIPTTCDLGPESSNEFLKRNTSDLFDFEEEAPLEFVSTSTINVEVQRPASPVPVIHSNTETIRATSPNIQVTLEDVSSKTSASTSSAGQYFHAESTFVTSVAPSHCEEGLPTIMEKPCAPSYVDQYRIAPSNSDRRTYSCSSLTTEDSAFSSAELSSADETITGSPPRSGYFSCANYPGTTLASTTIDEHGLAALGSIGHESDSSESAVSIDSAVVTEAPVRAKHEIVKDALPKVSSPPTITGNVLCIVEDEVCCVPDAEHCCNSAGDRAVNESVSEEDGAAIITGILHELAASEKASEARPSGSGTSTPTPSDDDDESGAGSSLAMTPNSEEAPEVLERANKRKRRVVFADDSPHPHQQSQFVTVRYIREPSDVPPTLQNPAVLALINTWFPPEQWDIVSQDADAARTKPKLSHTWELEFSQPVADYCSFRSKMEAVNVSLENVMMKNAVAQNGLTSRLATTPQLQLEGTIRVKNLAYEKSVFVRISNNNWRSFVDHSATYVVATPDGCPPFSPTRTPYGSDAPLHGFIPEQRQASRFDMFSFTIPIPVDDEFHKRLEFCVCFRVPNAAEFWDNNGGQNYVITSGKARRAAMVTPGQYGAPIQQPMKSSSSSPSLTSYARQLRLMTSFLPTGSRNNSNNNTSAPPLAGTPNGSSSRRQHQRHRRSAADQFGAVGKSGTYPGGGNAPSNGRLPRYPPPYAGGSGLLGHLSSSPSSDDDTEWRHLSAALRAQKQQKQSVIASVRLDPNLKQSALDLAECNATPYW